MLPNRDTLQTLGAAVLLALALACGGSSSNSSTATETTATITGNVTYLRVPLATTAGGPTGLVDATVSTNLVSKPAQGALVRLYQQVDQTKSDGTIVKVWIMAGSAYTDSSGNYSVSATKGRSTMLELMSTFNGGNSMRASVVAEPAGINSPTLVLGRLQYGLRKAVDGTTSTTSNTPASVHSGAATVNFTVGVNDVWWLVDPGVNLSNAEAPNLASAVLETTISGRTAGQGSGSRILGIGDSIATFLTNYGVATPGGHLDLHYWPGRSEPRGTYIEYNRALFPQAFDASAGTAHFFASIQGGPTNDDAWDEGVLFPMLSRGVLYATDLSRTFGVARNPMLPAGAALADLTPTMARIEGFADAMAANLLKSPYLADTQGTGLAAALKDVRTFTGSGPYAAPAIRALAWEVILKANSVTSPGTATQWATINPLASFRFFFPPAGATNGATDTTARDTEPINIYTQLARLQEAKTSAEPVDLNLLFTSTALTSLTTPFGITWPRPTTGEYLLFFKDWAADPTGSLSLPAFSMSKAVQVNGAYPNLSTGEVLFGGFTVSADKRCVLTATLSPALPSGARVDVDLPMLARTFSFTEAGSSTGAIIIPCYTTAPAFHPVRIRLISPDAAQPTTTVTLTLTPSL